MCRTGGRRCTGSHTTSRATQTTRKRVSRARKALRQAKTAGDATAIAAAQQRLDAARAAHQEAKDTMRHNDTARHDRDVTDTPQPGDNPTPPTPDPSQADREREAFEQHPIVRKFRAHPLVRHGRMTAEDMAREWNKQDVMVRFGWEKPIPIPGEPADVTTGHPGQQGDVTGDRPRQRLRSNPQPTQDHEDTGHTTGQRSAYAATESDDGRTTYRTSYNVVSGNGHVDQQVGFDLRGSQWTSSRHASDTGRRGDVTHDFHGPANVNTGSGNQFTTRDATVFTAGPDGDVTATNNRPRRRTGTRNTGDLPGFSNTNVVSGNARVGSQVDVNVSDTGRDRGGRTSGAGEGGDGNVFNFRSGVNLNTGSGTQFTTPDRTGRDQRGASSPSSPWGEYETPGDDGGRNLFRFHGPVNVTTSDDTHHDRPHRNRWHDDTDHATRAAAHADDVNRQARDLMRQHNIPPGPGGGMQVDRVNGRIVRINGYSV